MLMMVVVFALMGPSGGSMGMMGHDKPAQEAHGPRADDPHSKMSAPTEDRKGDAAGAQDAPQRP